MLQELFRIPIINRPVYGYGLMLVIGFLLAAQLARYLARRCGFNGETFVNAGLLALITGVIGARLSHILETLADPASHEFARNGKTLGQNLLAMLNVSSGGLTFYGGFLLATPILVWYAIRKKIPVLKGMDIIAPCLMIGLAFGRIGCYLNGCCYGEECDLPWGAKFPYGSNAFVEQYEKGEIDVPPELTDPTNPYANGRPSLLLMETLRARIERLEHLKPTEKEANPNWQADLDRLQNLQREFPKLTENLKAKPVHPTELYSAFNAFFIAAILLAFFSLNPPPGQVFALMLLLKGASRYILEMIRVEPPVLGNLSFSMVLSLILIAAGILMWLACAKRSKRNPTKPLHPAPAH